MLAESTCLDIIKGRLSKYRYEHSVNVAQSAKELAKLYNADEQKAYITGLVHDITKEIKPEEHLELFKKYNIDLDFIQKSTPKLWHSISGALFVRYELKESDEDIYNAIRFHTTGREGMSILEKIIFVSDFVSAERNYDGVDKIREILKKDGLEACVLEGLRFSVTDLADSNKFIHPDTIKAYNFTLNNI